MKRWILTKYYKWMYRNVDPDECCCGGYVSRGNPWNCGASCTPAKDYAIYLALKRHGVA